jgi:hypothetical protein
MFQGEKPLRTASPSCGRVDEVELSVNVQLTPPIARAFFLTPPLCFSTTPLYRACYHINLVRSCGSRQKNINNIKAVVGYLRADGPFGDKNYNFDPVSSSCRMMWSIAARRFFYFKLYFCILRYGYKPM